MKQNFECKGTDEIDDKIVCKRLRDNGKMAILRTPVDNCRTCRAKNKHDIRDALNQLVIPIVQMAPCRECPETLQITTR